MHNLISNSSRTRNNSDDDWYDIHIGTNVYLNMYLPIIDQNYERDIMDNRIIV